MLGSRKKVVGVLVGGLLAVGVTGCTIGGSDVPVGVGQDTGISVSGTGSAPVTAKNSIVSATISVSDKASSEENSKEAEALLEKAVTALSKNGIKKEDIRILGGSDGGSPWGSESGSSSVNRAVRSFSFIVPQDKTSQLTGLLTKEVGNRINVRASKANDTKPSREVVKQAQDAAFRDAKEKAEDQAESAGVKLGKVVLVKVDSGRSGGPIGAYARSEAGISVDDSKEEYTISVDVTFSIK